MPLAQPLQRAKLPDIALIDNDGSYNSYAAYCQNATGDHIVLYRKGTSNSSNDGTIYKSKCLAANDPKNAANWSAPTAVTAATGNAPDGHPNVFIAPAGAVLGADGSITVAVTQQSAFGAGNGWTIRSTDGGATFGAPVALPNAFLGLYQIPASPPIRLADNSLLMAVYGTDVGNGPTFYDRFYKSTDNGGTWTDLGNPVRPGTTGWQYNEPGLCWLGGQNVLLTIRVYDTTATNPYLAWSTDGGATWTTPTLNALTNYFTSAGSPITTFLTLDGDVVSVARGLLGDTSMWISGDQGHTWSTNYDISNVSTGTFEYGQVQFPGTPGQNGSLALVCGEENTGHASAAVSFRAFTHLFPMSLNKIARRRAVATKQAAPPPALGGKSGHAVVDGSSHFTVTPPASLVDGQQILVLVTSPSGILGDTADGFTLIDSDTGAVVMNYYLYGKVASSEPASWVFTGVSGAVVGWSCFTGGSAVNAHAKAHDVTSTPVATSTVAGCHIVALVGSDNNAAETLTIDTSVCTMLDHDFAQQPTLVAYDTVDQAAAGNTTARAISTTGAHSCLAFTVAVAP